MLFVADWICYATVSNWSFNSRPIFSVTRRAKRFFRLDSKSFFNWSFINYPAGRFDLRYRQSHRRYKSIVTM